MGFLLSLLLSQAAVSSGATSVPGIQAQNAGTTLGQVTKLNCSTGTTCTKSGSTVTITSSGGGGTNYQTVQQSGVALPQEPIINFTGAGVTCVDNPGATRTDCTITSGGGTTVNAFNTTVTFDPATGLATPVTVTGLTWLTSTSKVVCSWFNLGAVTNNTEYVYLTAGLHYAYDTIVVGTSLTVYAFSDNGATGSFNLSCHGI